MSCHTRGGGGRSNDTKDILGGGESKKFDLLFEKPLRSISNKKMAQGGIEPTTFALLARRSNQLSYGAN